MPNLDKFRRCVIFEIIFFTYINLLILCNKCNNYYCYALLKARTFKRTNVISLIETLVRVVIVPSDT